MSSGFRDRSWTKVFLIVCKCSKLFNIFIYWFSTSGRIYQLQAKDKQTMMFWLQELQVKHSFCNILLIICYTSGGSGS